jgi:hypothetical protein
VQREFPRRCRWLPAGRSRASRARDVMGCLIGLILSVPSEALGQLTCSLINANTPSMSLLLKAA